MSSAESSSRGEHKPRLEKHHGCLPASHGELAIGETGRAKQNSTPHPARAPRPTTKGTPDPDANELNCDELISSWAEMSCVIPGPP